MLRGLPSMERRPDQPRRKSAPQPPASTPGLIHVPYGRRSMATVSGTMGMDSAFERIRKTIRENDIVLFMEGTPERPRCGFSAMVVQMLGKVGVRYKAIDTLADPEIGEAIRQFTPWPNATQLYVKGEFAGGFDAIREMYRSGELAGFLASRG